MADGKEKLTRKDNRELRKQLRIERARKKILEEEAERRKEEVFEEKIRPEFWLDKYIEAEKNGDDAAMTSAYDEWYNLQKLEYKVKYRLEEGRPYFETALKKHKAKKSALEDGASSDDGEMGDMDGEMDTAERQRIAADLNIEDVAGEIADLKSDVEKYVKNKYNIGLILQNFYDKGLKPKDLLSAEKQFDAIDTVFSHNVLLAEKIKLILSQDGDDYVAEKEALKKSIAKIEDTLSEAFVTFEASKESHEKFSEEVASEYLKGKMGNVVEYFKEKPVAGILAGATIAGVLYWFSKGEKDTFRSKIWTGMKGLGLLGLGAVGANAAVSMYRDDGRSLLDLIFSNPESFDYDGVTERFKDEIEQMTDDNRHAFEAMMHMANADADAVYEVFDAEFRRGSQEKEINTKSLSAFGITKEQQEKINGKGLYVGLEALMIKIAEDNGKTGSTEDKIYYGLKKYKKLFHGKGYKFATIIYMIDEGVHTGKKKKSSSGAAGGSDIDADSDDNGKDGGSGEDIDDSEDEDEDEEDEFDISDEKLDGMVTRATEQMEGMFDKVAEMESSLRETVAGWVGTSVDTEFKTFIGGRKKWYAEQILKSKYGLDENKEADVKQAKILITEKLKSAKKETEEYLLFAQKKDVGSTTVLRDMMRLMAAHMVLDKVKWETSSEKVFNYAVSVFEYENMSYVMNDPEILVSLMELYVEKVEPGLDSKDPSAEDYTKYFLDQLNLLLPKDKNNFVEGRRQISTDEWEGLRNQLSTIQNYDEWLKSTNPDKYVAELKENDRERAIREGRAVEGVEFQKESQAKLEKIFSRTDNLEWSFLPSNLDELIGYRKERYMDEINDVINAASVATNARSDVDKILDRARKEAISYSSAEVRQEPSSESVQNNVQEKIIKSIVDKEEWESDAIKVLNYAQGFVEFEGSSYLFNAPEIQVEFLKIYFEKIDFGENSPDKPEDPADYTRFFIDKARKLMPSDINLELIRGKFQISEGEWKKVKQNVGTIESYEQWKATRVMAPEFDGFDVDRILKLRERQETDEMVNDAQDKIAKAFKRTDGLEWSFTADKFDSFVAYRKQNYMEQIIDIALANNVATAKPLIDDIVIKAEKEAMLYRPYESRQEHGSPEVLIEVQQKMLEQMIGNDKWHESAKKVLHYTTAKYEYEGLTYTLEEPEIFVQFMDLFLRKIGNGQKTSVEANQQQIDDYTRYFIYQTTYTLADDVNIDAFNVDGYVKQLSSEEWQRSHNKLEQIKSFDEWIKNPDVKPELADNDSNRGVLKRELEKGSELDKYIRERMTDIMTIFKEVDDLESSVFPDKFDAYIGLRRQWYVDQIVAFSKLQPETVARSAIDGVCVTAKSETNDYLKYGVRANPDSDAVLTEVMTSMTNHMISNPDWKKHAELVLKHANGKYEFEGMTYLIDDPEAFCEYMTIYFEKIGNGNVAVNPSYSPEDYTQFFMYKASRLLPRDKNWSLGSNKTQISAEEWSERRTVIEMIPSYEEWVAKGGPKAPKLPENDPDRIEKERFEQEKEEANKEFVKWFNKEMDPSRWTRFDGMWPNIYRSSMESRLEDIDMNAKFKTIEEYKDALNKYAKMVKIEKALYETVIEENVDPDEKIKLIDLVSGVHNLYTKSISEYMSNLIYKESTKIINGSGTPQNYKDAIVDKIKTEIDDAKLVDSLSVRIGALSIPVIDPIQFTPGGT